MNVQISCTICQEDLFTGEDNEAISSTKCGHVYHQGCLLHWIERSETCPHCRTDLGNNGIFKLNLFIGETSAVPSMAKFEELQNRVTHLTNVESDLKIRLEKSEIAHKELRESLKNSVRERQKIESDLRNLQLQLQTFQTNDKENRNVELITEQQNINNNALVLENETLRESLKNSVRERQKIESDLRNLQLQLRTLNSGHRTTE